MTRRLAAAIVIALAACASAASAQHARLFPPQDLGLLEGSDRDAWQRPDQIMDALQIGEGSVVADLGAGGGWFTVRLSRQVGPNGHVYAEDIQPQMIKAIERRMEREGRRNVTPLLGTADDPQLPAAKMDVVLIVDAYHEIERPVALLANVVKSLKPGGVVAIINFKKDGGGPGPSIDERVGPEEVVANARAAGLELRKREDFLRYQYMLTFGAAPK